MDNNDKIIKREVRSFVRREGRWTDAQRKAYAELAKKYAFSVDSGWQDQFANNNQTNVLEIGFGMGGSLAEMAKHNPDINYLGVEVHRPGVSALFARLDAEQITNVRAYADDVIPLIKNTIAPGSIHKVQIFFPDPWPKRKHIKRRLIQAEFLDLLIPILAPNAIIHVATDWQDYADHTAEVFKLHNRFTPADLEITSACRSTRPKTKFELRGLKLGHKISDLVYQLQD